MASMKAEAVDRWLSRHTYALALVVGVASYLALAPPGHFFGTGGEYAHPSGDLAQGMTAAYAYIDDAWRWPLFETERIAWPAGANIVYMDGIPIAALAFKVIGSITGVRINY